MSNDIRIQNRGTDEHPFGFIYIGDNCRIGFSEKGIFLSWGVPTASQLSTAHNEFKKQPWSEKVKFELPARVDE